MISRRLVCILTLLAGAGLPNPNLKPEHSRNWNVGYSHVVIDPGGTNPVSASCPNGRIAGYCSEIANIGKEVHEGVEFEVRSTPFPRA